MTEKVTDEADPERCDRSLKTHQCWNRAVPDTPFCEKHGGLRMSEAKSHRLYRLNKMTERVSEFGLHQKSKLLDEEIDIVRCMLEETVNSCDDAKAREAKAPQILNLIDRLEKMVKSGQRLAVLTGNTIDKAAAVQLADEFQTIIKKHVTDPDTLSNISTDFDEAIQRASEEREE